MKRRKARALVMFSGGLDSILAVKLLQKQGIRIVGINFVTPFSNPEIPSRIAKGIGIKLRTLRVSRGYFDMLRNPRHGYGANMNPCLDCKVYMLKRAKFFAKKIKADFIATGEVVGERPFSQSKSQLLLIEREAGLKDRIVRPLSARLLPPTEAETMGLVERKRMMAIQGRPRKLQMKLAKRFGIRDYPTPGGGCLLTDKAFSRKLRDFIAHNKTLGWRDVELLKPGRHFRLGRSKIIVGRNEQENMVLHSIAKKQRLPWMEVNDYNSPVTVLQGSTRNLIRKAAGLTVRYSDAPKKEVKVRHVDGREEKTIRSKPMRKKELEKLRIA